MNKYILTIHKDDNGLTGIAGYANTLADFLADYSSVLGDEKVCQITLTREPPVCDNVHSITEAEVRRGV